MRQHDQHALRTALLDEADRHRPDREAMLHRIAQGRTAPAPGLRERFLMLLRPVAAAAAVAVVLLLAVAGVRLSNRAPDRDETPAATPTAVPATPTPATTTPTRPAPPPDPATTPPRPSRTTTGPSSPPAVAPAAPAPTTPPDTDADGYLTSAGRLDPHSNDGWSQQNLELRTTRTLTALDVTVEVALTADVAETGRWSTVPTNLLTLSSSRTGKKLIFRFTLNPGATLAPGAYTFAVQFNHAAGQRSRADDGYAVKATGEGKDAKVSGNFPEQ